MELETKASLTDSTIAGLQKLIRYNIDSSKGFSEAADEISCETASTLFRQLGAERGQMADELSRYVEYNGEEAVDEGSSMAALHRTWINVRSMISNGSAYAILCEAERGEDYIKNAYEDVLKETAGSAMNDLLNNQYSKVKAGHDQVRDLRDKLKSK